MVHNYSIINLIENVGNEIKKVYARTDQTLKEIDCENGKNIKILRDNHATETPITKILLGTFGCVPAYDQVFTSNIKKIITMGKSL